MPRRIIELRILIFCCKEDGERSKVVFCFCMVIWGKGLAICLDVYMVCFMKEWIVVGTYGLCSVLLGVRETQVVVFWVYQGIHLPHICLFLGPYGPIWSIVWVCLVEVLCDLHCLRICCLSTWSTLTWHQAWGPTTIQWDFFFPRHGLWWFLRALGSLWSQLLVQAWKEP